MPVLGAGRRRSAIVAVAAASLVGTFAFAGAAAADSDSEDNPRVDADVGSGSLAAQQEPVDAGTYIVQLKSQPVASYDGDVQGLSATRPKSGASIDPKDKDVEAYRSHLREQRAGVLSAVPGAEKLYNYDTAFNGFAVQVDKDEASKLAHHPDVRRLWKNEKYEVDTVSTPDFLGLSGKHGVWNRKFDGQKHAGEGVIVGVIDTGIWPENPAFDALPTPRPDADTIEEKWNGSCDEGNDPDPENNIECNNKLIGADYFGEGVDPVEGEFESPRDHDGHGSHTASTAAGNANVEAEVNGESVGEISGMAPAARVAMYKACWTVEEGGGCAAVDLMAAIDQAVADGVDVINYSISGSPSSIVTATEIAFFNAAQAGVFVATSAGNDGPGASTVNHNSPWVTTVAASSHDRGFQASVTLGDGTEITGAGRGDAVGETDLVLASEVPAEGSSAQEAGICVPGSLDESQVKGKIVACARGQIARVEKSLAVEQAGGVGMIHYNASQASNDTAADFHSVPTVHVKLEHKEKIEQYAASQGATASLGAGERVELRAPQMAAFSSQGPAIAGGGDLLKPDVTAPGVNVVAAYSPAAGGENFASLQGTSMSSPHVAGIGALLAAQHPDWKPSRIKSALMTTATTRDNRGDPIQRAGEDATVFDYGSGHVNPPDAFNPGLAYESGPEDWIGYMCAIGQGQLIGAPCDQVPQIDSSDLNYPSMAVGSLPGTQTLTRTVTNTTDTISIYRASVDEPDGVDVKVRQRAMILKPGESEKVRIEITRKDAELDSYATGRLTWKGISGFGQHWKAERMLERSKDVEGLRNQAKGFGDLRTHRVSSPIVVRPVAVDAPSEVRGEGTSGSKELSVTAGYDGTLETTSAGLVANTVTELPLKNPDGSSFPTDNPQTNDHVGKVEVEVPDGASAVRFATYDSDYPDLEGVDLDVYVYRQGSDGLEFVGYSASGGSDESVTLSEPGSYEVYVDLWSLPSSTTELNVEHHHWVVEGDEDNLTVSPESQDVSLGEPTSVTAEWSGLESGSRYLGVIGYGNGSEQVGSTLLSITG